MEYSLRIDLDRCAYNASGTERTVSRHPRTCPPGKHRRFPPTPLFRLPGELTPGAPSASTAPAALRGSTGARSGEGKGRRIGRGHPIRGFDSGSVNVLPIRRIATAGPLPREPRPRAPRLEVRRGAAL